MKTNFQELREILREMDALQTKPLCDFTEEEALRFQNLIDLLAGYDDYLRHLEHESGCNYGRPDGPDDICKECDCFEE